MSERDLESTQSCHHEPHQSNDTSEHYEQSKDLERQTEPDNMNPGPDGGADNDLGDVVDQPSCTLLQALHDKYGCDEPLSIEICISKRAPGRTGLFTSNLLLKSACTCRIVSVICMTLL
jgi:hypothetical protein